MPTSLEVNLPEGREKRDVSISARGLATPPFLEQVNVATATFPGAPALLQLL